MYCCKKKCGAGKCAVAFLWVAGAAALLYAHVKWIKKYLPHKCGHGNAAGDGCDVDMDFDFDSGCDCDCGSVCDTDSDDCGCGCGCKVPETDNDLRTEDNGVVNSENRTVNTERP